MQYGSDQKLWSPASKRPSASNIKGQTRCNHTSSIGERDWTASRCIRVLRSVHICIFLPFFFPLFFRVIEANAFNSLETQLTWMTITTTMCEIRIFAPGIRLNVSRWNLLRGLNRFERGLGGISVVLCIQVLFRRFMLDRYSS